MSADRWMVEPCTDAHCILRDTDAPARGGMHTNGGCEHIKSGLYNAMVRALAAEVVRLRALARSDP